MTTTRDRITIALADDHTLFRQGLRELLTTNPEFEIVGEGSTGDEAVELVRRHRPGALLLDVEMPGLGTETVLKHVRHINPETAVIILTMHDKPGIVQDLLGCAAAAYLVKNTTREDLIAAIYSVSKRDNIVLSVPRTTVVSFEKYTLFSARELDVLRLLADAMSNAQIGARLSVTEGTVKRHLTNIYAKLSAVSRVDAVNKAIESKLI